MLDSSACYPALLKEIKERIRSAQYEALKAVNNKLILLYWDIWLIIVERQFNEKKGNAVVQRLSYDLQTSFPGIAVFSTRNIWYIRELFLAYNGNAKLQPLVAEISRTHNLIIMDKCDSDLEREFYIRMTKKLGRSQNTLLSQIENQTYEKTMINQTNFEKVLPEGISIPARLAVKDEYTFDFLEMGDERTERRLEFAILAKVEPFLQEMGGLFSFVGSQYRIDVGNKEYFIDLLLYHRTLRSLVAVELKTGDFMPEHVGKMQFYLVALNDLVKMSDENPSIGLILCKTKNKTIVEYALRESRKPIGVAAYRLVRSLPKELKQLLPDKTQIQMLMDGNGLSP